MLINIAGCGVWIVAAVLMTAAARADEKPANAEPKSCAVNHRNEQYDVNKDGKLDEQERAAMKADRAAKRQARLLAKYDANKNGQLDPEEEAVHKADVEKRRAARAEKKKAKEAEKAAQATAEEDDDDEKETKKP
jgi:3-methyladenine DNA glycosylase/8-oxoguanine DNA glycosylase